MALPPVRKTWQFQVNQTIAAAGSALACQQAQLLAIKNSLKGAGTWTDRADNNLSGAPAGAWEVYASSNGVTAGHDNVDRWVVASDIMPLTVNNYAWCALRNTQSGLHLLLQSSSVGTIQDAAFMISRLGFGAAHGGVNGTISTSPTATDQQFLRQSAAWGGPSTNLATVVSVQIATDGTTLVVMFRNSNPIALWYLGKVQNPNSGWLYPQHGFVLGSSGTGATNPFNFSNSLGVGSPAQVGWENDGTPFDVPTIRYSDLLFNGGAASVVMTGPSGFNSRYPLFSIVVTSIEAASYGYLGFVEDLFWSLDTLPSGDCFDEGPASSVRRFLHVQSNGGGLALPWNGSLTLVNPNGAEPSRTIRPAEFVATIAENADPTPPIVSDYDPPLGTPIWPYRPVKFSVTDDAGVFAAIVVYASFGGGRPTELVHDGTLFRHPYGSSVREVITNGFRYTIRRQGGWPTYPVFVAHAIDLGGNVNA